MISRRLVVPRKAQGGFSFLAYTVTGLLLFSLAATMGGRLFSGAVKSAQTSGKATTSQQLLSQAAQALRNALIADTDGYLLPPAGSVANGDGYNLPNNIGAPLSDANGALLRYCPWDHGSASNAGRIAVGDKTPSANVPVFAILSSGADKTFQNTCANLYGVITNNGTLEGDDIVLWSDLNDVQRRSQGSAWLLDSVDCVSAAVPTLDTAGNASNCAASTSRLDLLDNNARKEGEQVFVRKAGTLYIWQGGAWQIAGGVAVGSYVAPTAFSFTNLVGQTCSAIVESEPVQVLGIVSGTPLTITGGLYATSADNLTWSGWSSAISTIGPGTYLKLQTAASGTALTATTVIVNIGGTEKTWHATTGTSTPNAFSFTAQTGAGTSSVITSNVVNITGNACSAALSSSGNAASQQCSVASGAWGACSGSVNAGQTLAVRQTSSASGNTQTDMLVMAGGVSSTFSVTTGVIQGAHAYTVPGTYSWTAPAGVTSVSVVAVGPGNASDAGALAYKNNITVIPGNSYTVVVGAGGTTTNSYFNSIPTVSAGNTTTRVGDGGGNGGLGGQGASGAGGYSGNGANGVTTPGGGNLVGNNAPSGGGGGSGASYWNGGSIAYGGSGGGVGLFGEGASGLGGTGTGEGGKGGSGGTDGGNGTRIGTTPGLYGGGAGSGDSGSNSAGSGACRIIWPGNTRYFPATNTGIIGTELTN